MKENKLCIIVSDVNESHQFNALFDGLKEAGYDISLIFIGATYPKIGERFTAKNFAVEFIECWGKKDFPRALRRIYSLLGKIKPDIVHTHLLTASLLGLTAAKLRGIKRRIHTRHHSVELHNSHPHAVYYDKYCNYMATHIVAISRNVANVLIEKEKVDPARVSIIHHGFRLEYFDVEETALNLKDKYNLEDCYPIVGVISRFVDWKGVQYIIPAFAKVLESHPLAKLVLAGGKGDYTEKIHEQLAKELPPQSYVLIGFESHIFNLFRTFDVFVHAPIDPEVEAFGQIYVEALALEVPSIFTLSGIASDFIVDKKNALVVDFRNSEMIAEAVETLIENRHLKESLQQQGRTDVENLFCIDKMIDSLNRIYSRN